MNESGLLLIVILIVLLFGVAIGAQQLDVTHSGEFKAMMTQRDEAIKLAQESKNQKDSVAAELIMMKARVGDLNDGVERVTAEKNTATQSLVVISQIADICHKESGALQVKLHDLESEKQGLQEVNLSMRKRLADVVVASQEGIIPVTYASTVPSVMKRDFPSQNPNPVQPVSRSAVSVSRRAGLFLVVLLGIIALGSGGYVVYYSDPHHRGHLPAVPKPS